MELAKAIMLRLNAICCGLNFAFLRGQHCTAVEMHATRTASAALRFTTAVSRNGRFIDMLPLIPGSFTFIREVAAASARTASAKNGCSVWLANPAYPAAVTPASIMAPMNVLICRVLFINVISSLCGFTRVLLFIVSGIGEGVVGISHRRSPDHAGCRCGAGTGTPNHAECS